MLRAIRDAATVWKRRLGQKLLHSRLHPMYAKVTGSPQVREYRRFLEALAQPAPEWFQQQMSSWKYRPVVSILMAVRNSKREWLEQAVRSVVEQVYPDWRLCICDDASDQRAAVPSDPRIQSTFSETRLGISGALNRARELATGEYIGVLDHDDFLSPDALYRVVEALQRERYGVLYSDEEYVDQDGAPMRPNFKPDWSPELLSNCMYVGHLVVAARELMDSVGGFHSEFDGAQDYDLALRLTDRPVAVSHLPYILYHWRQHGESIAQSSAAKPWANDAGRRAAEDMVRRRGWNARVTEAEMPTRYHIVRHQSAEPVSILWSEPPERADFEFVTVASEGRNAAANEATGSVLVFLRGDIRPEKPDWLAHLVAQAQRPEVGAAGALLRYPDGSLEHSGLAIGMLDGVGHPGRRLFQSDYWRWLDYTRNVTAVSSACMAIRKEVFQSIGGFDAAFTWDFADADLCLRVRKAGYEIILERQASLVLHSAPPEPSGPQESSAFRAKWMVRTDPYYSGFLRSDREDASLRIPSEIASVEPSRER